MSNWKEDKTLDKSFFGVGLSLSKGTMYGGQAQM
jgi:hypothetical protein